MKVLTERVLDILMCKFGARAHRNELRESVKHGWRPLEPWLAVNALNFYEVTGPDCRRVLRRVLLEGCDGVNNVSEECLRKIVRLARSEERGTS